MITYNKIENFIELMFWGIRLRIPLSIGKIVIKHVPFIITLLDYIFPKFDDKIIFNSSPDYSDNAYAFYRYIKENYPDKYKCIWITKPEREDTVGDRSYRLYTLKGIYHILTSKYIVSTHANMFIYFIRINRHVHLNLWHGMQLKTLGLNEKKPTKEIIKRYNILAKNSYMFSSSDLFKISFIPSFGIDYSRVFITGQPRTDLIWSDEHKKELEEMFNFGNYKKSVLYLPTYKEGNRYRKSQVKTKYNNIFYMSDYDKEDFINTIERENILFIMKPHPFEELMYKDIIETLPKSKNFKIVFKEDFERNDLNLYELLKYIDLLISDFSSVTIDYLILNRPIIYLNNLSKEYLENRGFVLEDNYEYIMPGAKAKSYKELISEICNELKDDKYLNARNSVMTLMHKYRDNKSCERVYEVMKELK